MHPGMAIIMDTKDHGQVLVHLGPVWYLERQEFELNPGDEVRVKGMCEKEKDGKLQVTAYELTKGDYVCPCGIPRAAPTGRPGVRWGIQSGRAR